MSCICEIRVTAPSLSVVGIDSLFLINCEKEGGKGGRKKNNNK